MSYKTNTAKSTGKITEDITDQFFNEFGFNCVKPYGSDIGIDRIVTSDKYPGLEAKIQVKGRLPEKTPRWFQFKVNSAKIRDAIEEGKDLNELWKERIYMVDFWVLISIPKDEAWIFPSKIIHEIVILNSDTYKGRKDNNFSEVYTDKNGKIEKKQKELNLDIEDENGIKLYKRYSSYKFNISCVEDFFKKQKHMKRILSDTFITDLNNGKLLEYVKKDNTLDIEIREDYINIYYRGGNALRMKEIGANRYSYHFDKEYLKVATFLSKQSINAFKTKLDWNNYFPAVKQAMDMYFTRYNKEEREYQQLVVRENNYSSIANATDYFIADIEYDNHKNARFDIVAVEWLSDSSIRKLKKGHKPKLVLIEMKYGDGAFKGSAGIRKHISDFNDFIANPQTVSEFKEEMLGAFKQKRKLGLIPCLSGDGNLNDVTEFADEIEMMFLIANHDPAKSVLQTELNNLENPNIKFITSNFLGYGLYKENVFEYSEFIKRFKSQL